MADSSPADSSPADSSPADHAGKRRWSRRRLLGYGLATGTATLLAAGATGYELIEHGVLPGKFEIENFEGQCNVAPAPNVQRLRPGPSYSGTFYSASRRRTVGYTIAFPPGHGPGGHLPLVIALHAYGGNHKHPIHGMSLAQALALRIDGRTLPPMVMAAADGGNGYWNPHPGDNPLAMVIDELLPRCQQMGAGLPPQRIGTIGISMGGFGAIFVAERYPHLVGAAACIGPAIWTSYDQAKAVNPGAYDSAADFADDDAVTHAGQLKGVAVRVASGNLDPFHPGVLALVAALPPGAVVDLGPGCHTGPFFDQQLPPSMQFLAAHLT